MHIDDNAPPYKNSHFLYTTQSPGIVLLNHNTTVKFGSPNDDVWNYMLISSTSTGLFNHPKHLNLSVFPNPCTTTLHLKSSETLMGKAYTLSSMTGQTILSAVIASSDGCSIDISKIVNGVYYLKIDNSIYKIVKQ